MGDRPLTPRPSAHDGPTLCGGWGRFRAFGGGWGSGQRPAPFFGAYRAARAACRTHSDRLTPAATAAASTWASRSAGKAMLTVALTAHRWSFLMPSMRRTAFELTPNSWAIE